MVDRLLVTADQAAEPEDATPGGRVTFDQFVLSVRQGGPEVAAVPDSALREIFRGLDTDGSGTLSQAELDVWVRDGAIRPA